MYHPSHTYLRHGYAYFIYDSQVSLRFYTEMGNSMMAQGPAGVPMRKYAQLRAYGMREPDPRLGVVVFFEIRRWQVDEPLFIGSQSSELGGLFGGDPGGVGSNQRIQLFRQVQ